MRESKTEAELVDRLRAELAARSIDEARECPSWQVYADWLLERGDPIGEWLALTLAPRRAGRLEHVVEACVRAHDLRLGLTGRDSLRALVRNARGWTRWLGPFALATVQPGLDPLTLTATLGRHGALLLEPRTWAGDSWVASALARHTASPALLAVDDPALLVPIANALIEVVRASRPSEGPLFARPGDAMPVVVPPIPPINPGPVYDPDAMRRMADEMIAAGLVRVLAGCTGILCCAEVEDLERHAADWDRVRALGACVLLGPTALLERWPHPGRMLAR